MREEISNCHKGSFFASMAKDGWVTADDDFVHVECFVTAGDGKI